MEYVTRVANRIAGILRNHPKAQYVRITREEAEAIVGALKRSTD